jgi:uncharacterized protein YkwD
MLVTMLNSNQKMAVRLAAVGLMLALVAACGGGGSASPSALPVGPNSAPAQVTTVPVVLSTPAVLTVTTATYSAGSPEKVVYDYLNAASARCGFGLQQQSAPLDATAQGHADWQLKNNYLSHVQVEQTNGFTGLTEFDRIFASGYANRPDFFATDEIATTMGSDDKFLHLGAMTTGLLNAPHHMRGLLGGFKDIGISVRNSNDALSPHGARVALQLNLAYKYSAGYQRREKKFNTYPCNGVTGVKRMLQGEIPNPVVGRNLADKPLGTSVYMSADVGVKLEIHSSVMTEAVSGLPIVTRAAVSRTNTASFLGVYGEHETYVAADAPLKPLTLYKMAIEYSLDGVRQPAEYFTFTTGD